MLGDSYNNEQLQWLAGDTATAHFWGIEQGSCERPQHPSLLQPPPPGLATAVVMFKQGTKAPWVILLMATSSKAHSQPGEAAKWVSQDFTKIFTIMPICQLEKGSTVLVWHQQDPDAIGHII